MLSEEQKETIREAVEKWPPPSEETVRQVHLILRRDEELLGGALRPGAPIRQVCDVLV